MLSLSVAVSVDCPSTTFKMAGSFSRHIFLAQAGRIFFPAISSFFNPYLFSRHITNIFRQPVSCFPPYLSASRAFSGQYDISTPMKYEVWQWLAMDNRLVSIDMDMDHWPVAGYGPWHGWALGMGLVGGQVFGARRAYDAAHCPPLRLRDRHQEIIVSASKSSPVSSL